MEGEDKKKEVRWMKEMEDERKVEGTTEINNGIEQNI